MNKKLLLAGIIVFCAVSFLYLFRRQPISNQTLVPTSESVGNTTDQDLTQIRDALAAKYGWEANNIEVGITKRDGLYASGGVNDVGSEHGGGIWFAAKVDGVWKIVWDGNGIITCDVLEKYPDFPTSLIPQCFDPSADAMVTR